MKRVVVISDLHCGHLVGLTPPDWNPMYRRTDTHNHTLSTTRRRLWKLYADWVADLQPIHVLIVNGDAIEGKGQKSGGTELITADRNEQVGMAVASIEETKAKKVYMSYGTSYHTGVSEDWERKVADGVNAVKIGSHDWLDVNGLVFDYRHFVNRSSIPHGRYTPLARERLWNVLWNEHDEYPRGDVIVRSHVHYFAFCGGYGWLGVITPALCGYGSKYGARITSGTVDFGLVWFDIESKEDWSWDHVIHKFRGSRRKVMKA